MLRLYKAEDNTMNYMIIEDTANDTACIFDWDLSDNEILEITNKFENGDLTDGEFNDWKSADEIFENLFGRELLSYK